MKQRIIAVALAVAALLTGWSTPAWSAYLSCQAELKQGANCVAVTGTATNPIYVAATCQECTGSGSDVKCDPAEKVTAAGLAIKTSANVAVAGSFTSAGVTCDIGLLLFKFGGNLSAGQYKVTIKAGSLPETELLSFSVGGTPATDGQSPTKRDVGLSKLDGLGQVPRTETGLPISLDPKRYDEKGNPIGGGGGGSGGCGCAVAAKPRKLHEPALLIIVMVGLTLILRRCLPRSKRQS